MASADTMAFQGNCSSRLSDVYLRRNHFTKAYTVTGATPDSYNDIDNEQVCIHEITAVVKSDAVTVKLPPHSVNLIVIR